MWPTATWTPSMNLKFLPCTVSSGQQVMMSTGEGHVLSLLFHFNLPFLPNFAWCQFNSHLSSRCLIQNHSFQNALVNTYMLHSPPEMTAKTMFRYLLLNTITENPSQNELFETSAKVGFTRRHLNIPLQTISNQTRHLVTASGMVSAMFDGSHCLNLCFSCVWRNVQCPHPTRQSSNWQPDYSGNLGKKHFLSS
jgi:hypothetical protein